MTKVQTRVQDALKRLMTLHPAEIDLSLDRILRLLEKLGNPHLALPPVFHIAGTNGKGSTGAFVRALLEAEGKRVHVYTSPHLVRFNERIRLGEKGAFVSDRKLLEALEAVETAADGQAITFFEATTAAAFWLFAREPADVVVLEVGLGGILDATNVIPDPLVSIITPISLDHEDFLGNDLAGIAKEKAGIIKPERPVISATQQEAVLPVLERQAARNKAPFQLFGQEFSAYEERGRLVYQDENGLFDLVLPKLPGRHQLENAGVALAAVRAAGFLQDPTAFSPQVEKALRNVNWPARMQSLTDGGLVDELPLLTDIWVDGGHNPGAGQVAATFMADLEEQSSRPLFLVAGMMKTKDPVGFFANFEGLARHVLTVPLTTTSLGRSPAELAQYVRQAGIEATPCETLDEALRELKGHLADQMSPGRVLFCGSLYLAGEVLQENGTPPT
ncbi:folylpolyglutamate synthase/dihydrofolate synthase family protein [Pseudovibrio sp. SPO723]|uniref:bifunctional folylpolyglutamate synthase/dihydrofolate synthase n=1 Tax=Nesiotobacter zosterae TaxID=392721 RepID=UPI0029C4DCB0|nr:folylpolyglutamate synthase/dihydrofolate synthase family protein [Pseudovibrio sp. SPO723]MDX5595096.1 folylpolyglutamate synthase/dihydrofolate synthase family protein [Pseudovibrio sp. SPO723]